ncbi:methyltransferase [Oceanobacillus chungangensis]|uniref:SAM-dependent methyltransferase n=1 Tax=Oceanobacillus chungangensis TaxID=1229152 RepID=A0A3D8PL35_9BACI|nr:methyltransferase [Oceanobacillus chungangensis]RDW16197.1 SAM-dependent methyltransferase [Oceanobacillus chungangensis]
MKEYQYDKMLNIKTTGNQWGFPSMTHYNPYEPTLYYALEVLFGHYELKREDHIIDFGSGKGRLSFYIDYYFHAKVTGIEMNEKFYEMAMKNRAQYLHRTKRRGDGIQFYCGLAEDYKIDLSANRFYFFNPFSVQIFHRVIQNILQSIEESPRNIEIILYYPHDDYLFFLDNHPSFVRREEIIIPKMYDKNPYERFIIYRSDD